MKRSLVARMSCAALLCPALALSQVAGVANESYKTPEGRAGIARVLADSHREATQRPRDIVDAMGLRAGDKVADVGTGVGFMLPYLSHAVGPTGSVYAEDIAQDFLDRAKVRSSSTGLTNVKFFLGTDHDPKLPGGVIDAVLVLDTYHHFDYPEAMLHNIRDSLVSDGRLCIVDYYKRMNAMGPGSGDRAIQHIRLDMDDVIKEVEENGFKLASKRELLPGSQYIAIFVKSTAQ